VRDYNQREYGNNALLGGDRGDGENPRRCRCAREDRSSGGKLQPFTTDGSVDSRGYRARLQSDKIWEEHSGG
jgi:hypothetical protein